MKLLKQILKIIFIYLPISLIAISLLWVVVLKWAPVTYTPLMAKRSIQFRKDDSFKTHKTWKPIEDISSNLVLAVLASEDERFLTHNGFDWKEIKISIENQTKGKRLRGASTISQQTAKNVFLLPNRSWVRKGFEAYFTFMIEIFWSKKRIIEVYLNIIEVGKGIYGAEGAASIFFNKPASRLTRHESALIASALPNPLLRNIAHPSSYMKGRANQILKMMNKIEYKGWNDFFIREKDNENEKGNK